MKRSTSQPYRPMAAKAFAKLLYDTSAGCAQKLAVAEYRLLLEEHERVIALLHALNPRSRFRMNPAISDITAAAHFLDEVDRREL